MKSSWRADVLVDRTIPGNDNRKNYRDFSLMFQDEDNIVGVSFMPYIQQVAGITAVNYRSEPTAWRMEKGCDIPEVFACVKAGETPSTPLLQAHVGDPVAVHVLGAFSEQVQLFTIDGHEWPHEPYMQGADQVSTMEFGGPKSSMPILPVVPAVQTGSWVTIYGRINDRPMPMQGSGACSKFSRSMTNGSNR